MKKILGRIIISLAIFLFLINPLFAENDSDLVIKGLNDFTFDLYKKMGNSNDNIIASPYSLSSLLCILTVGASGNTQNQLKHILHMENVLDNKNIINTMNQNITSDFLAANAIWAVKTISYKKDFLELLNQSKANQFHTIDFASNPDKAREIINKWVADNTKNYIQNLIPQDGITSSTQLILTNALYFKGLWETPFDRDNTQQKPFTSAESKLLVPMMEKTDDFIYAENSTLQLLQLPYANSKIAMVILLPKVNHTLNQVRQGLNFSLFTQLIQSATTTQVHLSLPRFKLESSFDQLSNDLMKMGLTDPFNPNKANFSNMTDEKLLISSVIQKAIIAVDEKGTVAAAATSVQMVATAAYEPTPPPIEFNANHPFLFLIYDTQSKIILFIGQVANPK